MGEVCPKSEAIRPQEKPRKAESPVCCTEVVSAVSVSRGERSPAPPKDLVARGQATGTRLRTGQQSCRRPLTVPGFPRRLRMRPPPPVPLTLLPAARLCIFSGFLHRLCSAWEAGGMGSRTDVHGRPQPRNVLRSPGTAVPRLGAGAAACSACGDSAGKPWVLLHTCGEALVAWRAQGARLSRRLCGAWRAVPVACCGIFPPGSRSLFFFSCSFNDPR